MGELWFRLKKFYRWEEREKRDIIISILALAFIFGYNDGRDTFQLGLWLVNFFKVLFISMLTILFYDAGMKIAALNEGYKAEYRIWPMGMAISIIITLLTNGKIPVLLFGGLILHHMAILRLGKFRYGINTMAYGSIAAVGPFFNLILMTFALACSKQFHILPEFFDLMAKINGFMIIFQLLPLPRLNGFHIFFMSRISYFFIAPTFAAYVILSLFGILSWLFAFIVGTIVWFAWYWYVEGGKEA